MLMSPPESVGYVITPLLAIRVARGRLRAMWAPLGTRYQLITSRPGTGGVKVEFGSNGTVATRNCGT
jgi:hypothetical protein